MAPHQGKKELNLSHVMIERQPEEIDYTVALASSPSQRVFPQLREHALQLVLLLFVGFRRQLGLPNL